MAIASYNKTNRKLFDIVGLYTNKLYHKNENNDFLQHKHAMIFQAPNESISLNIIVRILTRLTYFIHL